MVTVRCECGELRDVRFDHLRTGMTKACSSCSQKVHGLTGTSLHRTWCGMRERCNNPKHTAYANYGGRGVRVCARWSDFANFVSDMGERPPATSLDRINNDGDYEPSNCRWSTAHQQARNKRKSRKNGEDLARRAVALRAAGLGVADIARELGTHSSFPSLVLHGRCYTDVTGIKPNRTRLDNSLAAEVWRDSVDAKMLALRMSQKELSRRTGVAQGTISSLLSGRLKNSRHKPAINAALGL